MFLPRCVVDTAVLRPISQTGLQKLVLFPQMMIGLLIEILK